MERGGGLGVGVSRHAFGVGQFCWCSACTHCTCTRRAASFAHSWPNAPPPCRTLTLPASTACVMACTVGPQKQSAGCRLRLLFSQGPFHQGAAPPQLYMHMPPPHPLLPVTPTPACCPASRRFEARSEFSNPTAITSVSSDPASQLQVCLRCVTRNAVASHPSACHCMIQK